MTKSPPREFLGLTCVPVAKGLMHQGLRKGDGVAFMCRHLLRLGPVFDGAALMPCGGVLATIYDTDSAEQIRNIVDNSDAKLLDGARTTDMREEGGSGRRRTARR